MQIWSEEKFGTEFSYNSWKDSEGESGIEARLSFPKDARRNFSSGAASARCLLAAEGCEVLDTGCPRSGNFQYLKSIDTCISNFDM